MSAPVGSDGHLPDSGNPDDALWYDLTEFSGLGGVPGEGNLTIFGWIDSGSVACFGGQVPEPCPGVFWNLRVLMPGDEVLVSWEGDDFTYTVTAVCNTDAEDFESLLAATLLQSSGACR